MSLPAEPRCTDTLVSLLSSHCFFSLIALMKNNAQTKLDYSNTLSASEKWNPNGLFTRMQMLNKPSHFPLCSDENFITPLGGLHKQSEVTAVCFSTGSPHLEAHAGSHCFQKSIKNSLET